MKSQGLLLEQHRQFTSAAPSLPGDQTPQLKALSGGLPAQKPRHTSIRTAEMITDIANVPAKRCPAGSGSLGSEARHRLPAGASLPGDRCHGERSTANPAAASPALHCRATAAAAATEASPPPRITLVTDSSPKIPQTFSLGRKTRLGPSRSVCKMRLWRWTTGRSEAAAVLNAG